MPRPTTPRDKGDGRETDDYGVPGAGTLYVYGINPDLPRGRPSSSSPGRKRISRDKQAASFHLDTLTWDEITKVQLQPTRSKSPDVLLERGIEAYTHIPAYDGGILGRGKFSAVYKVLGPDGQHYALKHTPLHPHHPLIAARLLREPTLLAQLPPHPCLIGVEGWVRTQGHFYLIEHYPQSYVSLPSHPLPLKPSRAAYILDQLVAVVRDCLHSGGRVVHRDLKGENVLIDVETGDILLLDLGLATHYSASEAKLTTCCGSPAFHSPEIVNALNRPPGEVTYYGPELDIWCIGLTLLSLLLHTRFPLGPSHKYPHVMRDRVLDRLQELDEIYPSSGPWRAVRQLDLSAEEKEFETDEWKRVRKALRDFLDIDGLRRMDKFAKYDIGDKVRQRCEEHARQHLGKPFKSITFIPTDIKYTLPLYLEPSSPPLSDTAVPLTLVNPHGLSEKKILSYIKYLFRSRGILYHCLPTSPHEPPILQLVLPYLNQSSENLAVLPSRDDVRDKEASWVTSLFSLGPRRASSVPPRKPTRPGPPPKLGNDKKGLEWSLKCWIRIEVDKVRRPGASRTNSRRGSDDILPHLMPAPTSPILGGTGHLVSALPTLEEGKHTTYTPPPVSRSHSVESERQQRGPYTGPLTGRNASATRLPRRPHPLSRQVSVESDPKSESSHTTTISSRTISRSTPRITIHLSDPRAYGIIRMALDVKHIDTDDAEIASLSPKSPAMTITRMTEIVHGVEFEEEKERGRPRSKEEPKVLIRTTTGGSNPTMDSQHTEHALDTISKAGVQNRDGGSGGQKPEPTRGRKVGFLDAWFGFGSGTSEEHEHKAKEVGGSRRSASSPPSPSRQQVTAVSNG